MDNADAGVNGSSVSTETDDGLSVGDSSTCPPSEGLPLVSLIIPANTVSIIPLPVVRTMSELSYNELLSENYELKNTIIDLRAQLEKKKNQDEYMNTLKQKLDALQQELAADSALRQSGTSDVQDNMDEFYNKVERKDKDLFEFVALVIWKAGGGKAVQKVLGILYDIYELSVECTADPSMDNDKIVVDTIKCLGKVLGIREYGKEAFKQMIADSNGNAGETINPEFQEYCESFNKRMKDMGDQIHAASAFEESSNEASSRDDPGTRRTTEPHTTTKKKGWGRFFNKKHKQSEAN